MKKTIAILMTILLAANLFAASYKVTKLKGEVYIITEDKELIPVEEGDTINDEDTIVVGDKSTIQFVTEDNTPVIIRKNGNYKVKELVK